jgi:hypothetical protein
MYSPTEENTGKYRKILKIQIVCIVVKLLNVFLMTGLLF